ncbi:MAG: hypothetical protein K6F53_10520 [Lachnospiraceae bacterium]|nr:hypothetical protein [Lachnospiraceae bacterium]
MAMIRVGGGKSKCIIKAHVNTYGTTWGDKSAATGPKTSFTITIDLKTGETTTTYRDQTGTNKVDTGWKDDHKAYDQTQDLDGHQYTVTVRSIITIDSIQFE